MLRQSTQHRLISRICLYSAVIGLLWLSEKAAEAQKEAALNALTDDIVAEELVASLGH